MTNKEFKKIARLLKELYKELEAKALQEGVDIFSEEYQEMQNEIRSQLLKQMGYTVVEYRTAKNKTAEEQKQQRQQLRTEMYDLVENLREEIPTEDKIKELALEVLPKPEVIEKTINKIVKETTVEKPTIVEKKETIIEREEYDDTPLQEALESIVERLEAIPEPEPFDKEGFMEEVKNTFGEMFEHNINTLDMPDFRKLAMGLQQQIDQALAGIQNIRSIEGGGAVKTGDNTVVVTTTGTVTLPSGTLGKSYIIKNRAGDTITVTAPTTIDGQSSQLVYSNDAIRVQFTGTEYIII